MYHAPSLPIELAKKTLVVGSAAAQIRNSLPPGRYPSDVDYICEAETYREIIKYLMDQGYQVKGVEKTQSGNAAKLQNPLGQRLIIDASFIDVDGGYHLAKTNKELFNYVVDQDAENRSRALSSIAHPYGPAEYGVIAPVPILLMMKMSHRFKKNSPHFLKTMRDIQYMRKMGWVEEDWTDDVKALYVSRMKETYDYGHPKLNQGKNEFFTDSVPYKYDHDTIHEAVKHLDKPAYRYYIKDGAEVDCSREKFEALPEIVKLYGVLEESYVLALERAVIPHNAKPDAAFRTALSKVCTSITSGWFREYAWEHYDEVMSMYHASYVDKFKAALADGKINPYKET